MSAQTVRKPKDTWKETWDKACREFEKKHAATDPGRKIKLQYREALDGDDVLAMIDTSDKSFNPKESEEGKKLSKVLNAVAAPLTVMINMFGGMAGAAYPPASQILGAVSFLVNAAKATQEAMAALGSLFDKLGQSTKRLKILNEVDQLSDEFGEIAVGILVCLLTVLDLAAQRKPMPKDDKKFHQLFANIRNHGKEYFRILLWSKDEEIQQAVATLDRLTNEELLMNMALIRRDTTVTRQAVVRIEGLSVRVEDLVQQNLEMSTRNFEQSKSTNTYVKHTDAVVNAIWNRLNQKDASATKKEQEKKTPRDEGNKSRQLQGLLKPAADANSEIYSNIKRDKIRGTGEWILHDDVVAKWLGQAQCKITLIAGPHGAGKTFLASRLVEQLLSRTFMDSKDTARVSTAYFFCKARLLSLSTVPNMLRTIAYQIAVNDPAYLNHIQTLPKTTNLLYDNVNMLWTELFYRYFSSSRARGIVYIVVDAIDECDSDEVQSLWDAIKERPITPGADGGETSKFNLLFTMSTKEKATIMSSLGTRIAEVQLDASRGMADFSKFVRQRSRKAFASTTVSSTLLKDIRATVIEVAAGNYLHASLMIDRLSSLNREDLIRRSIANPTVNLDHAIRFTLFRLTDDLDAEAKRDFEDILAWVSCAQTYLLVSWLDALLALRETSSARMVNLLGLLREKYSSLYIISGTPGSSVKTPAERMRDSLLPFELEVAEQDDAENTGRVVVKDDTVAANGDIAPQDSGDEELELAYVNRRAVMGKTSIRLEHGLLAQSIEAGDFMRDNRGLNKGQMRCKVLLGCLNVMTTTPEEADEADLKTALVYCATYLIEHIVLAQPSDADLEMKVSINKALLKLLRDDSTIDRWIDKAKQYMTYDLLTKGSFEPSVCSWLQAADTLPLLDPEERAWVEHISERPLSILLHHVAHRHAVSWLTQRVIPDDSFEFINTYLWKTRPTPNRPELAVHDEDGAPNGTGAAQALEDPDATGGASEMGPSAVTGADGSGDTARGAVEDGGGAQAPSEQLFEAREADEQMLSPWLTSASEDRIFEVARWAKLEENAVWYARIGHALRLADHLDSSLAQFRKSLDMDPDNYVTHAGMARTYNEMRSCVQAIEQMEEALRRAMQLQQSEVDAEAQTQADQDVADYRGELASYYTSVERRDDAKKCYDDLLGAWEAQPSEGRLWETIAYSAIAYLQSLANWESWSDAATLVARMTKHPQRLAAGFCAIYRLFLYGDRLLVIVARVAYYSAQFDIADKFHANAVRCLAQHGEDGETAIMRYNRAYTMLRLQPERAEVVELLHKGVLQDPELRDDTQVKVELARKYMDNILTARERPLWQEVGTWAHALVSLSGNTDDPDYKDTAISAGNDPYIYTLAAWDRISGRQKHARMHVKATLTDGVDMLSDDDESNDLWAWSLLNDATLAVGDWARTETAFAMLRRLSRERDETIAAEATPVDASAEAEPTTGAASIKEDALEEGESTTVISEGPAHKSDTQKTSEEVLNAGMASKKSEEGLGSTPDSPPTPTDDPSPPLLEPVPGVSYSGYYHCDGPCSKNIPDTTAFWRCSYCIADFCQACYGLIREGKNEHWRFCSATHEHVEFEGVSERWPKGMVKSEGKFVPVRKWLDELMEEYGIEKKAGAAVAVSREGEEEKGEEKMEEKGADEDEKTSEEKAIGVGTEEQTVAGASEPSETGAKKT